eukprot:2537648-Pyramimonas_sp.AAC.1
MGIFRVCCTPGGQEGVRRGSGGDNAHRSPGSTQTCAARAQTLMIQGSIEFLSGAHRQVRVRGLITTRRAWACACWAFARGGSRRPPCRCPPPALGGGAAAGARPGRASPAANQPEYQRRGSGGGQEGKY